MGGVAGVLTLENHAVTLTQADTEVAFALPSGTRRFKLQPRAATVRLAYSEGRSNDPGGNYFTVDSADPPHEETDLSVTHQVTLYLASSTPGTVVEIVVGR